MYLGRAILTRFLQLEALVITFLVGASILIERLLPVVTAAAMVFCATRIATRTSAWRDVIPKPHPFVVLLLLTLGVTLVATAFPDVTMPQALRVLAGLSLYDALMRWGTTTRRVTWLSVGFCLAGVALALAIPFIVDWQGGIKLNFLPPSLYAGFVPLISDTVNPNVMAGALDILWPLILALLFGSLFYRSGLSQWLAVVSGIAAVIVGVMMVLMQSRSALLASALAVLLLVVLFWKVARLPAAFLVACFVLFSIVNPIWLNSILDAPTTAGAFSGALQREEIWSRALYMIQDFSITGIGMGAFQQVTDLLYPLVMTPGGVPHAHNLFLQIAVDLGLPGLIAWLGILAYSCLGAWHAYRYGNGLLSAIGAGLLASNLALCIHGLTDAVTWGMVRMAPLVWALWGTAVAAGLAADSVQTRPLTIATVEADDRGERHASRQQQPDHSERHKAQTTQSQ